MAHVHAENMRLYAEDAAKCDEPWTLWQVRLKMGSRWSDEGWLTTKLHPNWDVTCEYRRTPITRLVKTYRACLYNATTGTHRLMLSRMTLEDVAEHKIIMPMLSYCLFDEEELTH